jgi:Dolichyl-phosphate-mannose-protein mannosyltransferase
MSAAAGVVEMHAPGARRPAESGVRRWIVRWLPIVVVWIAGAVYVGARLDTGWVPLDEGTLAHSAERVQHGELPHRDFDDVYTGGLARFDATVFEVLGTRLSSLRTVLFAVFLLWIPAVYYIATRFAKPAGAAAATLLSIVWTLPTNPSAMPSWYNLFLATFGIAAIMRFADTRHRRWLVAAGMAGGLSILVKIVGLFYVAGVLLYFAFDERQRAEMTPRGAAPRRNGYAMVLTSAAAAFTVLLIGLVRAIPRESRLLHFVLPGAVVAGVLAGFEWRAPLGQPLWLRLRRVAALVIPFAIGVAIPIAIFVTPYAASGAMGALVRGVLIAPIRRYGFAVVPPASLGTFGMALPWLLVLVPRQTGGRWSQVPVRVIAACLAGTLGLVLITAARGGVAYVVVWLMVCYLAPCTVLAGSILAWRWGPPPDGKTAAQRAQLWLLICMTAMCSLVQVPVASWGYILYFAPVAILALLGIVTMRPVGSGVRPPLVAAFFAVFGFVAVNPNHIALWKGTVLPSDQWARVPLPIPRTGLTVSAGDARTYKQVVALLAAHSPAGGYIYAAPDCPELYFLTDRRNPTRTLFDFFDDTTRRDVRIVRDLDVHDVTAIAINTTPEFSPPVGSSLRSLLVARYPDSAVAGDFVVRWRPAR